MKSLLTEKNEESGPKFILHRLTQSEELAIKERAAKEMAEAQARMDARASSSEKDDTMGEFDRVLTDWLKVNEGRHLRDKGERAEYKAAANAGGVLPAGELPKVETYTEHAETGLIEDN